MPRSVHRWGCAMTHSEFLINLANDIRLSHPLSSMRLMEVAHDLHRLQEFADALVGNAMADALRAHDDITTRASAELMRIVEGHARNE
jgi:hypothetical protein